MGIRAIKSGHKIEKIAPFNLCVIYASARTQVSDVSLLRRNWLRRTRRADTAQGRQLFTIIIEKNQPQYQRGNDETHTQNQRTRCGKDSRAFGLGRQNAGWFGLRNFRAGRFNAHN